MFCPLVAGCGSVFPDKFLTGSLITLKHAKPQTLLGKKETSHNGHSVTQVAPQARSPLYVCIWGALSHPFTSSKDMLGTSFSGKFSILAGRAGPSLLSHPMVSRKFLFLNTSQVSSQLTHRPLSQPSSSTPVPAHRSCSGMPTDGNLPPLLTQK